MSNTLSPVLKWAGGKGQLLDRLTARMPESYNRYFEPFVGAGAFFLYLAPHDAVINDINLQLVNVYNQLRDNNGALIDKINELDSIPGSKERYYELRKEYNDLVMSGEQSVDTAALMIWINKHCFNGLYRVNAKGGFNVPYNNKEEGASIDAANVAAIGQYLATHNVEIRNVDFVTACEDVQEGDFVYFDSPYVPVSKTADFTSYTKDGFTYEDHVRLADLFKELDKRGAKLMLSNNDVPLVYELYDGYNIQSTDVNRAINSDSKKRKSKELIITNY